jgi:hypothetical protein
MALELRMDIIVDSDGTAKAKLAEIDGEVKKIEQSATGASGPVGKLAQGLSGTANQTDRLTGSSAKLDQTTQRLGGELVRANSILDKYDGGMSSAVRHTDDLTVATSALNTGLGSVTVSYGLLGGALAAFMLIGLAEVKFLYDSSKLYLEKSGILRAHESAIDDVSSAWTRLRVSVGEALVGSDFDLRWFIRSLEGGINGLSVLLTGFVAKFRSDLNTVVSGIAWMAEYIPGAKAATALFGAAYLNGGGRPQPGYSEDSFEASYLAGLPGRPPTVPPAVRPPSTVRPPQITPVSPIPSLGYTLGITQMPGFQYPAPVAPPAPFSIPSIGVDPNFFRGGVPGANVGYPQIPNVPAPGFFGSMFGGSGVSGASAGFLGQQLSSVVLQAITGGGSIVGGVGSLLGGGLGTGLSKLLTGGAGISIGGFAGGALNAILPGIGALLGPALNAVFGKLFGPTEYEKRTRAEAADRKQIAGSVDTGDVRRQADFVGQGYQYTQFMDNIKSGSPAYLKQILAELDAQTEKLTGAMQRYGISWEDAGQKAKQSQIDLMAKQFVEDFDVLNTAGFDVDFIIGKMGDSMLEFLETAKRTSTEVPIAMKPMLQRMLDMGLITDDSGKAFDSLEDAGILFAQTMTQNFKDMGDRMVAAIDRVALALGYVFTEYDGKTIHVGIETPNLPGAGGFDVGEQDPNGQHAPEMHSGGYLGWPIAHSGGLGPDEFPLIGQSGEYMMQRSAVQKYGTGFMAAVNNGEAPAPAQGGTMVLQFYRNNRKEAEELVRFIPGAVRKLKGRP